MTVRLELPGVWFDQVILDDLSLAGGDPFFIAINRIPEPNQIQVRTDSLISVDLATDGGDTPSAADTQLFVSVDGSAEVLIYDGGAGGFQPGWDGPLSATSNPDAQTLRITVDYTAVFDSLQVVTIHLVAASTGAQVLDQSWAFTIEDLTAPTVLSAVPTSKSTIRVTFDEPLDPATAAIAANYTIARLTVPAVNVVVESVEIPTSSSVILTLDIPMTRGAEYRLTVTGVEDILGNESLAPYNLAEFVGFQPMVPDGRNFDLWRMVPRKNREEDPGDLEDYLACVQEVVDLLLCSIDEWTDIIDPDRAPEDFVDAMLADLGNPFEFDLDLADKRRLIRILVPIYKQKGTAVGIINAVRFFVVGVEITINAYAEEGWILGEDELGDSVTEGTAILGPGTTFALYSFEIVSPIALTAEQRVQIKEIADYMKPAHTHCIRIVEPETPTVIDHLELGLSELGDTWILH